METWYDVIDPRLRSVRAGLAVCDVGTTGCHRGSLGHEEVDTPIH
jgi:hypothetical protein